MVNEEGKSSGGGEVRLLNRIGRGADANQLFMDELINCQVDRPAGR